MSHGEANFFNKMYNRAREQGAKQEREAHETLARELGEKVSYYYWKRDRSMESWEILLVPRIGYFKRHILAPTQREAMQKALELLKEKADE